MAKKSVLFRLYSDLVNCLSQVIDRKRIFLQERPKVSPDGKPMKKFAVIDLPVSIRDFVIGQNKTYLTTAGVFYLFTAETKEGCIDASAAGDFIDSVVDLFPLKSDVCSISNPVVRMTGNDGNGFHVATITFDLQTKWKAFEE